MSEQKPILEYGKPPKKRRRFSPGAFRLGCVCLGIALLFAIVGVYKVDGRSLLMSAGYVGILSVVFFVITLILFFAE